VRPIFGDGILIKVLTVGGFKRLDNKTVALIRLIRPQQWYKNLLVFIPAVYALSLFEYRLWPTMLLSFISACLVSGANYILNDIHDLERDKRHPSKRFRPLPSGLVSPMEALAFCFFVLSAGFLSAYLVNQGFFLTITTFFLVTQLYTFVLKRYPFVDIVTISFNYVIRAVAGAYAIEVPASPWLIVGIFFLALLLSTGKRAGELMELKEEAMEHREVLRFYTEEWVSQGLTMASTLVILTYAIYCIEVHGSRLLPTLPLAVYLIMRYNHLVRSSPDMASNPHRLFSDKGFFSSFALWLILTVLLLYLI